MVKAPAEPLPWALSPPLQGPRPLLLLLCACFSTQNTSPPPREPTCQVLSAQDASYLPTRKPGSCAPLLCESLPDLVPNNVCNPFCVIPAHGMSSAVTHRVLPIWTAYLR